MNEISVTSPFACISINSTGDVPQWKLQSLSTLQPYYFLHFNLSTQSEYCPVAAPIICNECAAPKVSAIID